MARCAEYGSDLKFSENNLMAMHNADLVQNLGNLVNRAVSLCSKYNDAKVPDVKVPKEMEYPFDIKEYVQKMDAAFKNLRNCEAANAVAHACSLGNKWLAVLEPWKMKDDVAKRDIAVRQMLEVVYVLAHLFSPFIPRACAAIFKKLNTEPVAMVTLKNDYTNLKVGTPIEVGDVLFDILGAPSEDAEARKKKAEADKAAKKAKQAQSAKGGNKPKTAEIDRPLDDVARLNLRVGKIVEVWEHPDSEKLWCEKIDVGEGELRQIASGLRKVKTKEDMLNAMCVVCVNLKTRKLAGFESQGTNLQNLQTYSKLQISKSYLSVTKCLLFVSCFTMFFNFFEYVCKVWLCVPRTVMRVSSIS